MEAIWNREQLERPPNASCRIERQKFDAREFSMTLDKVINELSSQELFHKEAAILSRLIYRMKSKFRNDKGVKSMSKVNKALLKYLSLLLEKEYTNLKDYIELDERYVTLPSKQMVEYVLIKTQSFAKLMLRVEEVSKYSAHFLKCRIGLGHAWSIAVIAYAVVSRIWLLSRFLVKRSCVWYNDLYPYLKSLKNSGLPWLPTNYELTHDLKSWLLVPWIDEPTPSVPKNYALKNTMFKLITSRGYDSDEDLLFDEKDSKKEAKSENATSSVEKELTESSPVLKTENKDIVVNDDTGESIDRRAFNLKRIQDTPISTKGGHKKLIKREGKEESPASLAQSNREFYSESTKDKNGNKDTVVKVKRVARKDGSKKLLTFNDAKNKQDLVVLLNNESYPGWDKLQWNMIRNKSKKLLDKLEGRFDETNQSMLFKKMMKCIKKWIT